MSDLDNYISTVFLGSSKTNIMELFQYISSRTKTELLLLYSYRNLDKPGSADSYLNKSYGAFVKTMIIGGIIGTNLLLWLVLIG